MTTWSAVDLLAGSLAVLGTAGVTAAIRARQMHYWLGSHLFPSEPRLGWSVDDEVDVFIAICDHWEPRCYGASHTDAVARVQRWKREHPRLAAAFADVDGRVPQHTFFFPEDEYRPEYVDGIRPVIDAGFGDLDVHLHHHNDTPQQLREKLERFRDTLFQHHGLLRRDPATGDVVYGFIHGNWALCNSRPDGSLCGVNEELTILHETGCYADFTLPSAPSPTQTSTINSIYYAANDPGRSKSHDRGIRARVGQVPPANHLLMIQGPLLLDWGWRRAGVLPRIENGDLHESRGPSLRRLKLWINAGVHVAGRPQWRFVKLHTHGCKQGNIDTLLGEPMRQFHAELAAFHQAHPNFRYHYVTAWEMAQLVHQAEQGQRQPAIFAAGASLPDATSTVSAT